MVGNMANSMNGRASAVENPSIPIAGPQRLPIEAASTSKVPIIGPVHEKDTNVRVNAMKNMDSRPVVRSAVASILFDHDAGSFMSKAPKNEMANTTRRRKKMMLQVADVDSALSELAPKRPVISRPRAT